MQVHGNTQGLAASELRALERLYRRRVPFDVLTTHELARALCEASHKTSRQVGVLVDRTGTVEFVIIGDAAKIDLPDIGRLRAARGRFRGLRLVHTHLRNEPLSRDDLVDLTLLRLDLVVAICVSPEGLPVTVHWAHCVPPSPDVVGPTGTTAPPYRTYGPIPYAKVDACPARIVPALEDEFARIARTRPVRAKDGRAILVHVADRRGALSAQESLRELEELARSAGVEVVASILQVRDRIDPKFVLGRGKLEEVVIRAMQDDVDVLVFDRNLTPAQAAAIAAVTDLKVLDRTQVILDIFAQRAESRDGKLQVELAQMKYLLPRLGQKDDALSRLTGGIGGRGPGETKLEIGKRRARDRITHLEQQLSQLARQRVERRRRRSRRGVPIVAIVGYTNAGKSTLLNALTDAGVLAADKLFATLDTRARRIRFPEEREVVITDTVGFIRDLPEELFAAFRATFEEAEDADLLLWIVDVSDPSHDLHLETTRRLLDRLGLGDVPRLIVYNKADKLHPGLAAAMARQVGAVAISALDRSTLPPLLHAINERLFPRHGPAVLATGPGSPRPEDDAPSAGMAARDVDDHFDASVFMR